MRGKACLHVNSNSNENLHYTTIEIKEKKKVEVSNFICCVFVVLVGTHGHKMSEWQSDTGEWLFFLCFHNINHTSYYISMCMLFQELWQNNFMFLE